MRVAVCDHQRLLRRRGRFAAVGAGAAQTQCIRTTHHPRQPTATVVHFVFAAGGAGGNPRYTCRLSHPSADAAVLALRMAVVSARVRPLAPHLLWCAPWSRIGGARALRPGAD
jgi:hypothetical protein